jgi:hypothetical protein
MLKDERESIISYHRLGADGVEVVLSLLFHLPLLHLELVLLSLEMLLSRVPESQLVLEQFQMLPRSNFRNCNMSSSRLKNDRKGLKRRETFISQVS